MFGFEERGYGFQPRSGARMQPTAHDVGYGGQTASPNGAEKCFLAQMDGPVQARVTRGTERPLQKFRHRRASLVRLLRGSSRERNNGDEPKAHIRG